MKKGLVYIFEGNGKGKTSAALGVACRMLLVGGRVVWVAWYKEASWEMAETKMPRIFNKLKMYWTGKGFYKGPMDHGTEEEHRQAATEAMRKAKTILLESNKGEEKVDLLVLDEVIKAVNDGLVKNEEILELLTVRGETHLVLTGHKASQALRDAADLVTEMKKIKHPYDKGILAVRGLDF